jgi:hypothetical protein
LIDYIESELTDFLHARHRRFAKFIPIKQHVSVPSVASVIAKGRRHAAIP